MILSIQSHVVYGYVGNKAACFPLQSLGYDVWPVNTVQFSNHTGYGKWQGEIFSPEHIKRVIQGIRELGVIDQCKAVLSGYIGESAIGEVILSTVEEIMINNQDLLYLCDPVMGDIGRDVFVKDGVVQFFKDRALYKATIISPNHFEAELLYGAKISTIEEAKNAANYFHNQGIRIVIFTSFTSIDLSSDKMHIFLSDSSKCFLGQTPLVSFSIAPNGTGDLFSALFLGFYLEEPDSYRALYKTLQNIYLVINNTWLLKKRELDLINHHYTSAIDNKDVFIEVV